MRCSQIGLTLVLCDNWIKQAVSMLTSFDLLSKQINKTHVTSNEVMLVSVDVLTQPAALSVLLPVNPTETFLWYF